MYHATDGYLAATSEWLTLHVDLARRRVAPLPDRVLARAQRVMAVHAELPLPEAAGRVIEIPQGRV